MTEIELLTDLVEGQMVANDLLTALCIGVAVGLFVLGVNAWRILK